jgi:hypothetical protein
MRKGRMDRDIETLFEELENMMNAEWVCEKVSDLKQKTLQAIATARADALREEAEEYEARIDDLRESIIVANSRISSQLNGDVMPLSSVTKIIMIQRDMKAAIEADNKRAAILADKQEPSGTDSNVGSKEDERLV